MSATVFTPDSFAAMGSRSAIAKTLQRMVARGELLGTLWPSADPVVKAFADKDRTRPVQAEHPLNPP